MHTRIRCIVLEAQFLFLMNSFHNQECESEGANKMVQYLRDLVSKSKPGEKYGKF